MKYHSNQNIVYSCKYHIIWCPKYRKKVLVAEVDSSLKTLLQKKCEELSVEILEMEVMADHVHLLVEIDPQLAVCKVAQQLKGYTSFHLRKKHPMLRSLPSLWTNSYFVSTVGGAPLQQIKQYIENQKNVR